MLGIVSVDNHVATIGFANSVLLIKCAERLFCVMVDDGILADPIESWNIMRVFIQFLLSFICSDSRTSSSSAILDIVFKSGCMVLLHHLLTVQCDFPSCSTSHLPVLFCSTRTTFMRFKSSITFQYVVMKCKLLKNK